jgi:hypothetical protein
MPEDAIDPTSAEQAPAPSPVQRALSHLLDFLAFYRDRTPQLWRGVVTFVPFLHDPDVERRELRFDPRQDIPVVEAGAWLVKLPDLCVICAEPAHGPWVDEPRRAWDLTRLVAWLASGLALAFVFLILGQPILATISVLAGMVLGYVRRRSHLVRVRLRRCTQHASVVDEPRAYIIRRRLIVRTGAWRVKRQWLIDRGELPPEGTRPAGRSPREDPDQPIFDLPSRSNDAPDLSPIEMDDDLESGPRGKK